MANLALVTAGELNIEEEFIGFDGVLDVDESIAVGHWVRLDTTNGKLTLANGTAAAEARPLGVVTAINAGIGAHILRKGVIEGIDLSGMDYDAYVYLSDTDGTAADADDGTVDVILGRVVPGQLVTTGTAADKLLFVDL